MTMFNYLIGFVTLVVTQSVEFACDQSTCLCSVVTPPSCGPSQSSGSQASDYEDCARNCCPLYMCDGSTGQCVYDGAGGYPKADCEDGCQQGSNGWYCDPKAMQCKATNEWHNSKNDW